MVAWDGGGALLFTRAARGKLGAGSCTEGRVPLARADRVAAAHLVVWAAWLAWDLWRQQQQKQQQPGDAGGAADAAAAAKGEARGGSGSGSGEA